MWEFEKSLKLYSIRQITTQNARKSPQQLSTAFLLRTFACKYLFHFVIEIPIQILIIFYPPESGPPGFRVTANTVPLSGTAINYFRSLAPSCKMLEHY